jgi:hypothetical protein
VRFGDRCPEGFHDGDHRRPRDGQPRGVLRHRRLPRAAGRARPPRAVQRGDPNGRPRHGLRGRALRRGRRHHLGLTRRLGIRRDRRQGEGADGAPAAGPAARDPRPHPRAGVSTPRGAPGTRPDLGSLLGLRDRRGRDP